MADMKLSRKGAMELIGHEAIVLTRYLDSKKIPTIGVGHTKAAGAPDPNAVKAELSLREVFDLFVKDAAKYEKAVNAAIKVPLTQTEFDALVSFHFNTGRITKATLTKSINSGNKTRAAEEFMNFNKPPEIAGRRKKEQKLFAEGVYSNGGMASIFPATAAGTVQFGKGKRVNLTKTLGDGSNA
jgi:lysozyme